MNEPRDPHRLVGAGYDLIARTYERISVQGRTSGTVYRSFLDGALADPRMGDRVLDLGCGAGLVAEELARRGRVVGVDLSWEQLRLARRRVPDAALVQADMARLAFAPASFDAVAMFWSLIHVRRELHAGVLEAVHGWLRPGGLLFGTFGSGDNPAERNPDFHGAPMYWSHYDAATNRRLLAAAGFRVERADEVEDLGEHHLWVVATA